MPFCPEREIKPIYTACNDAVHLAAVTRAVENALVQSPPVAGGGAAPPAPAARVSNPVPGINAAGVVQPPLAFFPSVCAT